MHTRCIRPSFSSCKIVNLAAMGFEPTLPKRLVLKTSALDLSHTLPDAFNSGPKPKSRGESVSKRKPQNLVTALINTS